MEYYSAIKRNEMEVFVMRWMELESVIQSEVSQKEKNKYCMLTHTHGIKKKKMVLKNLGAGQESDVDNGLEDTGRGKGKLGRSERVAWTYIHHQM